MLEDPPVLTLREEFPRPSFDQMRRFHGAQTAHVVDSMDGRGALERSIMPQVAPVSTIVAPALTAHCYPADNMALLVTLEVLQPGDFVICATDSFRDTAVTGDLVAGMLRNAGAVGLATDGTVRDQIGIEQMGLPVFHAGVTPNSPAGIGPGTVGLPITCGGVRVCSGDLVVADRDGVVIVPYADIDKVADRLDQVRAAEAVAEAAVKAGKTNKGTLAALDAAGKVKRV